MTMTPTTFKKDSLVLQLRRSEEMTERMDRQIESASSSSSGSWRIKVSVRIAFIVMAGA